MYFMCSSGQMSNEVESHLPLDSQDTESLPLRAVCTRDATVRKVTLDTISQTVEKWLEEFEQLSNDSNGENCNGDFKDGVCSASGLLSILMRALPELFKYAHTSPFDDVRECCTELLQLLKVST